MEKLGWNTVFQVVISEDVLVVIIRDNYRNEMKQTLLPAISFRCSIGELDGPFITLVDGVSVAPFRWSEHVPLVKHLRRITRRVISRFR